MMSTGKPIPDGFTLHSTLRGHTSEINRIAWSPNGRMLASSSFDKTIKLWSPQAGQAEYLTVSHTGATYGVAWSPDGQAFASCSQDKRVVVWNMQKQTLLFTMREQTLLSVGEHSGNVYDIAWVLDNACLASCSADQTIKLWDMDMDMGMYYLHPKSRRPIQLKGHASEIFCLAHAPKRGILASGSSKGPIRTWDVSLTYKGYPLLSLRGHTAAVYSLAWSPDGVLLASCSEDHTVRLWKPETEQQLHILEGHTDAVTSVSFSFDGRLLASKSRDGTIRLWHTDTWEVVAVLKESASNGLFAGVAFHPNAPMLATVGDDDRVLHIWELDIPYLLGIAPTQPSVYYRNAKVVLMGESGVGKSGLALVLANQPYMPTDSTHGRYVWNFDDHEEILDAKRREIHETLLWDLAGQPGYRLIHQLHLSEVAVALVVFDAHSTTDPFAGIPHWVRALRMAQRVQGNTGFPLKKLLVAARTDRGHVKVSRERIEAFMKKWGFDGYIETSALEGLNISALTEAIKQAIAWDMLPMVTSTDLFQQIKTFLVKQKAEQRVLSTLDDLYRGFLLVRETTSVEETLQGSLRAEFETCIGLVESQGLIRRLTFGDLILLQPELLDAYASALINAARNEPDELGSIPEYKVKAGNFFIPESGRIPNWEANREQEKLLLIAMVEDLLRHEIALREEQGVDKVYLVFPSEAVRENPDMPDPEGKSVIFSFEGPIQNIYTTLAVRLSHSGLFARKELWKDAITYKARVGGTCGMFLQETEEGRGQLTLFFDKAAE